MDIIGNEKPRRPNVTVEKVAILSSYQKWGSLMLQ
jgi:hypothetical protein